MGILTISLYVPRHSVKTVKTALEKHGLRDKSIRIQKVEMDDVRFLEFNISHFALHGYDMYEIWANVKMMTEGCKDRSCPMVKGWQDEPLESLLEILDLPANVAAGIELGDVTQPWQQGYIERRGDNYDIADYIRRRRVRNPIDIAVQKWSDKLPSDLSELFDVDTQIADFFTALPYSYSIYSPMLLISSSAFDKENWGRTEAVFSQDQLKSLWALIAAQTRTTHIAINAPIPLQTPTASETPSDTQANTLRAPTNLTPLHGSFGAPGPIPSPTAEDLTSAFWVSHTQNRIKQIWAPRHTMFSRGNIREKKRLLGLYSVTTCASYDKGFTAVDLYCGIGYFAFSYARAGAKVVLGWELNKWSVEGMKRGIEANRWVGETVGEEDTGVESVLERVKEGEGKWKRVLVVFHESNLKATKRVEELRGHIPPVRHVNLGLLPTAEGAWDVAVRALDPEMGGWLHVHENIAVKEPEHGDRVKEIVAEIQKLAEDHRKRLIEETSAKDDEEKIVQLEHVEKVKTYAPGVMHCVIDIFVGNRKHWVMKEKEAAKPWEFSDTDDSS